MTIHCFCSLGDELAMWTSEPFPFLQFYGQVFIGRSIPLFADDVFRSTKHRAINRTGVERYSMPLFFGVDYGVMLEVGHALSLLLSLNLCDH